MSFKYELLAHTVMAVMFMLAVVIIKGVVLVVATAGLCILALYLMAMAHFLNACEAESPKADMIKPICDTLLVFEVFCFIATMILIGLSYDS